MAERIAYAAPTQAPEAALPVRLAAGDEAALREAYRANHVTLRRFARRLVGGDAAAADDLVHEVFVRLPRAVRRMRPETPLASFLVSVAVNHARHHVRAAARRRRAQARLAREPRPAGVPPDRDVERRQLAQALVEALDQLPLDQRVAFVLCEVEERTSGDAAALVGTNDSTMRARLFHAKRKLRVLLSAWGERDEAADTGGGTP